MKIVAVNTKQEQKKFLSFRKSIYKTNSIYVDNNLFMIKELFNGTTSFVKGKKIQAYNIYKKDKIVCQGIVMYTKKLPEYIQLCSLEVLENNTKAIDLLIKKTIEIGKKYNCKKLVVGLYGHVNYGLGFQYSDYDKKNSFSSNANPKYYNEYFDNNNYEKVLLNTYKTKAKEESLLRYKNLINKLNNNYEFRYFDKHNFDYYVKIYTDLNNKAFINHRYYYKRKYEEDKEMLKELFLFMKRDSLIFAFKDNKPIGFVMWYPDYNELAKPGEAFGPIHFIKNIFLNKTIKTGKIMEYGILEEYRKSGLVMGLLNQVFIAFKKHKIDNVISSWILEENKDSNSVCQAFCEKDKRYVVYEKEI